MSKKTTTEELANSVIDNAETEMHGIDPSPFSPSAFRTLKDKIAQYVSELVSESTKISKRHQADTVSSTHVEKASEYLILSSSRRIYRHLGTLGGIFLGAAVSHLLAMNLAEKYTDFGTITTVGLGIAGAFMVALHIAKE